MSTAPSSPPATTTPSTEFDWAGPQKIAMGAAVIGLAIFVVAGGINLSSDHGKRDFLSAFLAGWIFWLSLPVGGMALLMIHYLAKTSWGVLLKRPIEAATRTFPFMVVLFIPFAALALTSGTESPYWWVSPETAATAHDSHKSGGHETDQKGSKDAHAKDDGHDHDKGDSLDDTKWKQRVEMSKQQLKKVVEEENRARNEGNLSFLSPPVFVAASVIYFLIWGTLIFFLNKWGQDAEEDAAKVAGSLEKLKNISGPGLILYAITLTAAISQWVMSLEPGWASTMFPVISAVNQFLTCFAFSVALFLGIASRSPYKEVLREKFQLDMGTLMLAFTLFWSYTSFSQLLIIWIGNLPEEIPFYLRRSNETGWWYVSAGLIVFHFAVPFLLLLFRDIKLDRVRLRTMAMYLLVVCAVDVTWWVEPTFEHSSPLFVLMDAGAIVGIGGLWGLLFLYQLRKRPLLPKNEMYQLPEGHSHENH